MNGTIPWEPREGLVLCFFFPSCPQTHPVLWKAMTVSGQALFTPRS